MYVLSIVSIYIPYCTLFLACAWSALCSVDLRVCVPSCPSVYLPGASIHSLILYKKGWCKSVTLFSTVCFFLSSFCAHPESYIFDLFIVYIFFFSILSSFTFQSIFLLYEFLPLAWLHSGTGALARGNGPFVVVLL